MATRMLCAAACCGSRRGPAAGLTAAPRTVPAGSQEAANSLDQSVWPEKFAFPDHQLCPARPGQQPAGLSVARHVPPALRAPVLAIVHGRTLPATARMNVPKAAMYVDNLAQTRQDGATTQSVAYRPAGLIVGSSGGIQDGGTPKTRGAALSRRTMHICSAGRFASIAPSIASSRVKNVPCGTSPPHELMMYRANRLDPGTWT
jgi:hypothetical protein